MTARTDRRTGTVHVHVDSTDQTDSKIYVLDLASTCSSLQSVTGTTGRY